MAIPLSADYLVIGAGATGIAFVDELIHGDQDVKVILVDKRAKPGGHWTDAYDFVKLHQPSAWYGVNSRQLGSGGADLTSKAQILAYYELVLEDLEATGRLSYYPQCEYLGDGKFISLLEEDVKYKVVVSKKIVDATYLLTAVPSTIPPKYQVEEGVNLIPINGLVKLQQPWKRYVIIGAGKTGLDALLFLLDQKVDPDRIVWIVSNDCWYFNRDTLQVDTLYEQTVAMFKSVIDAKDINEAFQNYEDSQVLMRIDRNVCPRRFRAATVSSREMEKLQTIKNIIRKGRIERIELSSIIFQNGEKISTNKNTLHVDCSTASTGFPPAKKIWDGNTICLQLVQFPTATTSGAMIAAMELNYPDDEEKKNEACCAMDAPHFPWQFFKLLKISNTNGDGIGEALGLGWLWRSRLSFIHHMSMFQFIKTIVYIKMNGGTMNEKLEAFSQQEDIYGKGL